MLALQSMLQIDTITTCLIFYQSTYLTFQVVQSAAQSVAEDHSPKSSTDSALLHEALVIHVLDDTVRETTTSDSLVEFRVEGVV